MRVSAAHAARDADALRQALPTAAELAGPEPVEEALLQAYLFLGFPATIWAFGIWRPLRSSLDLPAARPGKWTDASVRESTDGPDGEDADDLAVRWRRFGEAVCARIYGANYGKLRENVRRLHPELDRWMIMEGYGKVLSRPHLDLVTRELCIVALLAVTSWAPQLHSHLRGALNAGADPAEVEEALEVGLRHAAKANGPDWPQEARGLWTRVRARHVR